MVIDHLNQLAARSASDNAALNAANETVKESISLWVPSERVLVFRMALPKVSRRKQLEMLPWMLEDQLLSSPDNFEFFVVQNPVVGNEDSESLIYVVEKTALGQWMLLAEAASVAPEKMVPDFLALPYEEGRWTVYTDEGRMLVRTGLYEGFATELGFGWQQLELMISQLEEPIRLSHLGSSETLIPDSFEDNIDSEAGNINWAFTEFPLAIDILPDAMRPKRTNTFKQWLPVVTAAVFLLVFSMSYMLVQTWAWQRDAVVLEEAVGQNYKSLFGKSMTGGASDLVRSAEAQLAFLEHQYIALQTSPLVELSALDRVFSTCSDCVLMDLKQLDSGVSLKLKDNSRLKSRLQGIDSLSLNWSAVDAQGVSTLTVQSTGRGVAQ